MSYRGPRWITLLLLVIGCGVTARLFYLGPFHARKRFSWEITYQESSAQPFGTQVLFRLLKGAFAEHTVTRITEDLHSTLPLNSDSAATYFFIGKRPYYDSAATQHLLRFVEEGSVAFLCGERLPFDVMFFLYEECPSTPWVACATHTSDSLALSLAVGPPSEAPRVYMAQKNRVQPHNWSYLPSALFCPNRPQRPLGYGNDSLVNFALFPYGKGYFLLHTTPLAFTNYHLLREEMRGYAERVLALLPPGDIYWDVKYREPEEMQAARANRLRPPSEHPLQYILQKPPLAWAWYLLLTLALLYLLFRGKRRQRIIPILVPKRNTSFEYVDTLARLHFQQRNYIYLYHQIVKRFLAQVRLRYGIDTPALRDVDPSAEGFIRALAQAAGVSTADVRAIFSNYRAAVAHGPSDDELNILRTCIEAFWMKANAGRTVHS